jgi:transposase
MPKTYKISYEEGKEAQEARKTVNDKQTDKRLWAVQLRSEGKKNEEIAERLETSADMISRWVCEFVKGGVEALMPKQRTGRPRNISHEEEEALLKGFAQLAESGQIIEVSDIEKAYQEKVGHRIGTGQIYYVLRRHGWRKVMPRSKHPNKASDEAIEASKKLTLESEK